MLTSNTIMLLLCVQVDTYPGAAVSLNVRVVDELNLSIGATIRLEDTNVRYTCTRTNCN